MLHPNSHQYAWDTFLAQTIFRDITVTCGWTRHHVSSHGGICLHFSWSKGYDGYRIHTVDICSQGVPSEPVLTDNDRVYMVDISRLVKDIHLSHPKAPWTLDLFPCCDTTQKVLGQHLCSLHFIHPTWEFHKVDTTSAKTTTRCPWNPYGQWTYCGKFTEVGWVWTNGSWKWIKVILVVTFEGNSVSSKRASLNSWWQVPVVSSGIDVCQSCHPLNQGRFPSCNEQTSSEVFALLSSSWTEVLHPWKAVNVVHMAFECFIVTRNCSIDSFVSD